MRYPTLAAVAAATALLAAAAVALPDRFTLFTERADTRHGDVIADTLAVRELCGAETRLAWELSSSTGLDPLPELLTSRDLTGTVHARALACSVGTPRVTPAAPEPGDPVTVTLAEPRVAYAWVDLSKVTVPRPQRGILDRFVDGVGCLVADCGTVLGPVDSWLDAADTAAARHAAESDAVATARTELPAVITGLLDVVHDGPITVEFQEAADADLP